MFLNLFRFLFVLQCDISTAGGVGCIEEFSNVFRRECAWNRDGSMPHEGWTRKDRSAKVHQTLCACFVRLKSIHGILKQLSSPASAMNKYEQSKYTKPSKKQRLYLAEEREVSRYHFCRCIYVDSRYLWFCAMDNPWTWGDHFEGSWHLEESRLQECKSECFMFHDISRHFRTFQDIEWSFMPLNDISWYIMIFIIF